MSQQIRFYRSGDPYECRDKKKHRLYHAMDMLCPCGPSLLCAGDSETFVNIYKDDIVFYTNDKETLRVSDLLNRIEQLEQEVKELSSDSKIPQDDAPGLTNG